VEAKPSVEATIAITEAAKAAWVEATVTAVETAKPTTVKASTAEATESATVETTKPTAVEATAVGSAEAASISARGCRHTERSSRQKSNSKLSHFWTTHYTVLAQHPSEVRCRTNKGRQCGQVSIEYRLIRSIGVVDRDFSDFV
jgi:hypothetical protein